MASLDPRNTTFIAGYARQLFTNGVAKKYLCSECGLVLREPVQALCGHRFCKLCLESKLQAAGLIRCKKCESEGIKQEAQEDFSIIHEEQLHPDNAVKREMGKLNVACTNSGCSWRGIFRVYEEHFSSCAFRQIICQHCRKTVKVSVLQHHADSECQTVCGACDKHILLKNITEHRDKECPKAKVVCADCGQTEIVRESLQTHLDSSECRKEPIHCPACCRMVPRKEYQVHFHRMQHEAWLVQSLDAINNRTRLMTNEPIQEISAQIATQVTFLEEKASSLDRKLHDMRSQQSIQLQGSISVLQRTENIDAKIRQFAEIQLQPVHKKLDDTTGNFEGETSALHRNMEKIITGVEKLERHYEGISTRIQQINNQIQAFERKLVSNASKEMAFAELELKAQALLDASYDGTLLWKVSEFSKLQQNAIQSRTVSIYSSPFYTSRRGYKMCARLYPNGDGMGKGSHLSLFFTIMRGQYDPLLKWPFSQRVHFCLINQDGKEHIVDSFIPDPQSSSFKRPTSDMNIASGCPLFVRLELLQNPVNGFLKDDTIFLKITVDTSEITDPLSTLNERLKT